MLAPQVVVAALCCLPILAAATSKEPCHEDHVFQWSGPDWDRAAIAASIPPECRQLRLVEPHFDDLGCSLLGGALAKNHYLESLTISHAYCGPGAVADLVQGLRDHPRLEHLSLCLGPEFPWKEWLPALCDVLVGGSAIRTLSLRSSGIDDGATVMLAAALKTNARLEKIDLRSNPIGTTGAAALEAVLQCCNTAVKKIQLPRNEQLTVETTDRIAVLAASSRGHRIPYEL